MTGDAFRELALALDGAIEASHMGHPDFRANGRIFATLRADERTGMVKLTPEQQAEFLHVHPGAFVPSPGGWGRQGCTDVVLASAKSPAVRAAMLLAYQAVMERPRAKARKVTARSRR
jgi:hypothetical protein